MATQNKRPPSPSKKAKAHNWRLCPVGEHWVTTHPLHIPPSQTHPEGSTATRRGHCAKNPSGKDQLYPDEIGEISKQQFSQVKEKPCSLNLGFKKNGAAFDDFIAGWTQYWNDVLQPKVPLDPNTVKALIASESGFNPKILANKKNQNSARGLMQITNEALKTLGNEKGEIKDHYITLTREDLNTPHLNICAGIRWLFQKQKLASNYLGRDATWEETIENFKGLREKSDQVKEKNMNAFNKFKEELNLCKK